MRDLILEALSGGVPLSLRALTERLDAPESDLASALEALEAEGAVVTTKKGRYTTPEAAGLFVAHAFFTRNGSPMARPAGGGEAVPIAPAGALRCLPDDLILARPEGGKCAVHTILRRGKSTLPAYIRLEHRRRRGEPRGEAELNASAVPCDVRIPYAITLTGDLSFVKNDEIALLRIERYPELNRPIRASVMRVLGNASSLGALMKAVAEDHGFATEAAPGVELEAEALPTEPGPADLAGREDLRALRAFTIDGETAKDFDDAVSIERTGRGYRLGVHIADVSHYVRPGTDIDADARLRGTSLYLPGLTVPMLPERLCNALCSLMPDADRLTMSLFMDIEDGAVVDHRLVRSVIHSHARLTYRAVNRLFDGEAADLPQEIANDLRDMLELSHALRRRRESRGAIDFDMDEPEFILDESGAPAEVLCAPRGEAERLIEDFMLAANETVAALARSVELPFVYRVHEPPDADRLLALERFLSGVGLRTRLGADPHPGRLRALLEEAQTHPAGDVIRHHLLRALKRAQYSERPLGHYALAMQDYCHFTSPIRRYPDLIVHRMLKLLIDGDLDRAGRMAGAMADLAAECSQRENAATLAERQGDGIMMAAYMSRQIGCAFDGVISSVTAWGFYVTLANRAEGLVHIAGLDDDYYTYDAGHSRLVGDATGAAFSLGDRVRVRVERVFVPAGEIDFALLPPGRDGAPRT